MKQKIFMVAMIIAALSLPLEINAKGKPTSVALLKDANGVEIGRVIGMPYVARPYVLTEKGYRTQFLVTNGNSSYHILLFSSLQTVQALRILLVLEDL